MLLNNKNLPAVSLLFCLACSQNSTDGVSANERTTPRAPEVYNCDVEQFAFSTAPATVVFYPQEIGTWVVALNTCEGIAENSDDECQKALSEAHMSSMDMFFLSPLRAGPLAQRSGIAHLGERYHNLGDNHSISLRLDTKTNVLGFGGEISALSSDVSIDPSEYDGFSGGGSCVRSFPP